MSDSPETVPSPAHATRLIRLAFLAYASMVFTLTHWPKLKVPGPEGTDIIAHMTAFGGWTFLCCACAFFGRAFSVENASRVCVLALLYAGIDEGLQAIPILGRTCCLSDYGANALGILAATLFVLAIAHMKKR